MCHIYIVTTKDSLLVGVRMNPTRVIVYGHDGPIHLRQL